jgi:DNA (cytosine-5)-methyltransferase 1
LPVLLNGEGYEPMAYDQEPGNDFQRAMRRGAVALYDHKTRRLNEKQFARVSALGPGEGLKELPEELRPRSGYSGAYGRLDFEMVAPTITRWVFHPGSGRYCHPREARLLTIREAARLQSFSDDFRFTGTYIERAHQVGNAVPPLIMEALAPAIEASCREREAVGLLPARGAAFEKMAAGARYSTLGNG